MVFACPQCRARYRLGRSRIDPGVSRVRCCRCQAVFRVPKAASPPASFLVAMGDADKGKQIGEELAKSEGDVSVVSDGCEALLAAVRNPPTLAVLDEELAGLDAYQLCEVMKRTRSPGSVTVLVTVSEEKPAVTTDPDVAPDRVFVRDDIVGALPGLLRDLGIPVRAAKPGAPRAHDEALPVDEPDAEARLLEEERTQAARLARIIVSDIVLYDPDRFDEAAQRGRLKDALATELREGRALFERRIDARVRSERNYLDEELQRIAFQRGNPDAPDESRE